MGENIVVGGNMATGAERREYLRVSDEVPVMYRVIERSEGLKEAKMGWRIDIGGGGLKLLTKELLEGGTWLEIELSLKEEGVFDSFVITGEVVWSSEIKSDDGAKFLEGIAYIRIKDDDRKRIIKYVNSHQRKQSKKIESEM